MRSVSRSLRSGLSSSVHVWLKSSAASLRRVSSSSGLAIAGTVRPEAEAAPPPERCSALDRLRGRDRQARGRDAVERQVAALAVVAGGGGPPPRPGRGAAPPPPGGGGGRGGRPRRPPGPPPRGGAPRTGGA